MRRVNYVGCVAHTICSQIENNVIIFSNIITIIASNHVVEVSEKSDPI